MPIPENRIRNASLKKAWQEIAIWGIMAPQIATLEIAMLHIRMQKIGMP